MRIVVKMILYSAALLALPRLAIGAQATVTGVVTIEERSGGERADIRSAVVYLEPREHAIPVNDMPSMRSRTVAMHGREFIPHVQIVLAGGSVAFPNEDPFSHNVFSNVDLGPFDLGLYRRGTTRSATFARPGVYPIYCNIHSMMVSFVVAVPAPWATQPDESGRFVLRSVPPGRYVVHAWHEHGAREVTREIVIPAAGIDDLPLVIDARTYVDAPHLNKFGRPYALIRDDRY
ncbi:MAG TPA: carboxypeptidase regulatory-like domain-containing protein [Actinomycetota bacterium]|nr:carboxypeptidase regulatory-like domain-containing protein [Actinomycetota bacterium]